MITIKQLYDGLVSGEIKIDENGHNPFYGWGPDGMIKRLGKRIEFWDNSSALSKKGIVWSESLITESIPDGDKHIREIELDSPCANCNRSLGWRYDPLESKIICFVAELNTKESPASKWFYEYQEDRCELEHNLPQSFEFKVNGEIVFANFFKDHIAKLDEAEKDFSYNYFSLNTIVGRRRIAEFHANDNIGYQQLGNTSIDIYLSSDKQEFIIIEETYRWAEGQGDNSGMEFEASEELPKLGWIYCGSISCDMWRYMFGNVSDVKEPSGSVVKISPKPGNYLVTNYFGTSEHEVHTIAGFKIASRVKLIG